jgi:capsular polysaccharide biosynthesis protein
MLRIGQYVHPGMREVWDRAGERLSSPPVRGAWPERIFHTRSGVRRACRNRAEVEDLFRSEGFEIISPAEHSLAEQVQLARHARTIAGFAGSGMYQIAFTGEPKHVVAIAAEAYAAHNEHLIAGLLGHRLDLLVCRADVPRADPRRFSGASYASSFEFDLDEDAAALRRLLG